MSVAIREGPTFDHDPPRRLFSIPVGIDVPGARLVYDVTSDGRFLMARSVGGGASGEQPSFVLVTNFLEELEDRVPTR
jgi:hypothetical protein